MIKNSDTPSGIFRRAREIIEQDVFLQNGDKRAFLQLFQQFVNLENASEDRLDEIASLIVQQIITGYSLQTIVQQQADELDALKNISLNLTSSLDLQTVLDSVVAEALKLVRNARSAHIFLHLHGALTFGASLDSEGRKNNPTHPREHGLTQSILLGGEQVIIEDTRQHPLYLDAPTGWHGSVIGVPLKFDNEIMGVMNLSRGVVGGFSHSELRLISLLADHAAVAIYNADAHTRATQLANTDSVTGLPNRRALDERLQEEWMYAKRNGTSFSVVMMDLDGFKAVNDTYGHDVGDELLHSLFNFLAGKVRTKDFLARYGGDELTLVMHNTDLPAAEVVTKKMIDLLKEYRFSRIVNSHLQIGLTAGIAAYPNHAHTPSDLLRAADAALYHAKKYYRGSFAVAKGMTGMLNSGRVKGNPSDQTN